MFGASIVALRGWEIVCIALFLVEALVIVRYGRTRFMVGLYAGATVAAVLWDWILRQHWFFNLTFDGRDIPLYTLDGHFEPLWAPVSYGFFFGITPLLAIKYRDRLDRLFGNWQYPIIGVLLGIVDIGIEGTTVGALDLYRFGHREEWLIAGVPYTNVLFVAVTVMFLLYTARWIGELLERSGMPMIATWGSTTRSTEERSAGKVMQSTAGRTAVAAAPTATATEPSVSSWGPFVVGLTIPAGAIYFGVLATTALQAWTMPWL